MEWIPLRLLHMTTGTPKVLKISENIARRGQRELLTGNRVAATHCLRKATADDACTEKFKHCGKVDNYDKACKDKIKT